MTKIIGINSSPNRNNRPEKQRNDKTKNSTLWTGFTEEITEKALTNPINEKIKNKILVIDQILNKYTRTTRLELATLSVTGLNSNQLSYVLQCNLVDLF